MNERACFSFVLSQVRVGPIITAYLAVSNGLRHYKYHIGFVGRSDGQEPYDLSVVFYDGGIGFFVALTWLLRPDIRALAIRA
jgi:hypothetical protein